MDSKFAVMTWNAPKACLQVPKGSLGISVRVLEGFVSHILEKLKVLLLFCFKIQGDCVF